MVAVHSDSWLMGLAFYKGARLTKEQRCGCLVLLHDAHGAARRVSCRLWETAVAACINWYLHDVMYIRALLLLTLRLSSMPLQYLP